MKPKVEPKVKQEIVARMVSSDLNADEKQQYMQMLAKFPDLFITSYEEIRGFQGEDLHIELKEDAKLVQQKLRKMRKEQMQALKEEVVDKLLHASFIYLVWRLRIGLA